MRYTSECRTEVFHRILFFFRLLLNTNPMKQNTYNSGVIGNCAYIAHISKTGNVNWLCWPQFDSSFVFGSLIDDEKGGHFSISPLNEEFSSDQYYIENTNILCTEIHSARGSYRITDFAPRFPLFDRTHRPLMMIRKIERISGHPKIVVRCKPAYEYGQADVRSHHGSNHIRFSGLPDELRLTANIPLNFIEKEIAFQLFETKYLVLTYGTPLEAPLEETCETFLHKTIMYWRNWIKACRTPILYQDACIRSALILKIHQYEQTGAIIAASTTSLPEYPGTGRTWDYRFCWMRDAYYTLTAFSNIGHFEELEGYFQFIANISHPSEEAQRLQPLYSINGESKLVEIEHNLKGYLGNQPVRTGNDAYTHIQNDVYGQVLVSLLPLYIDKRFIGAERSNSIFSVQNLLSMIEATMNEPDAGLWEFREQRQLHGYTYLFHWAGSCAAGKMLRHLGAEAKWIDRADRLARESAAMLEKCYDPEMEVYTQAIGSKQLDASMLQLITMGYLDDDKEKALKHLRGLERELKQSEATFYRYKHSDDFGKPETSFVICSYWFIEALARLGLVDEARQNFEKLLSFRNHLGLLSEHVNPVDGSQWGNFPQTYSHVGLLNAAFQISRTLNKPNFLTP
jgi:GH15 family glucan-1,4-alpha-glucosidase